MAPRGRRTKKDEPPPQLKQPQSNRVDLKFAQQFLAIMCTFAQATAPQPPPSPLLPQQPPPTAVEDTRNTTTVVVELFKKQQPKPLRVVKIPLKQKIGWQGQKRSLI